MIESGEPHVLVDHLFRDRAGQMVAWLTRIFGPAHLELAEEVVQDALLKALQQWPYSGIPDNPAGWLFRVARNGALDVLRRNTLFRDRAGDLALELTRGVVRNAPDEPLPDRVLKDDELRLVFLCCHPSLSMDARVALSLKTMGGFSAREIARAFLADERAIAQRLVRAKRQLRDANATLDLPTPHDLASRVDSVLEVIYLLFNEGYAAHDGTDLVRVDLCREGLRLARLVASSEMTGVPAAHALASLLAFQAARLPARVDENGELVLLEDQDRSLWDKRLIAMGFRHLSGSARGRVMSVYHVQAAIAAAHAGAARPEETRWEQILRLYDELLALNPSPVVALNRIVALSKVSGPAAALEALGSLEGEVSLSNYYLLPAVKGRLLSELGRPADAARAYEAALRRGCSEPERRFLQRRLERL